VSLPTIPGVYESVPDSYIVVQNLPTTLLYESISTSFLKVGGDSLSREVYTSPSESRFAGSTYYESFVEFKTSYDNIYAWAQNKYGDVTEPSISKVLVSRQV
jgi:hypothetical protein